MDISAFRDELTKILEKRAGVGERVVGAASKKPLAALAATLAAGGLIHHEGSKAVDDLKVGRAYRKQMEQGR